MSWQDEQRRLDEELSSGQISPEGYQRRRYELMYRYGGDEADAAQQQPDPADRRDAPFPPAFRWETAPPDQSNEATQLFTPVDADETQVVGRRPADPDGTQVVRGTPSAQRGPQPWSVQQSAPSWTPSDLPPAQQSDTDWMRKELESFESGKSSKTPLFAAIALVVVLLLTVGGFGAYWLLAGDGAPQAGQPGVDQPRPAAPVQQPPPPRPGADLPDPAEIGGDGQVRVVPALSGLQAADVLTPEEYSAVAGAGAGASKLLVTSFADRPTASILITRFDSGAAAAAIRDDLVGLQQQAGFKSAPTPDPDMQSVYLVEDPRLDPTVRGYYRSGDLLVRMEVVGTEPVPTARRYDTIVEQQLATLPADA